MTVVNTDEYYESEVKAAPVLVRGGGGTYAWVSSIRTYPMLDFMHMRKCCWLICSLWDINLQFSTRCFLHVINR